MVTGVSNHDDSRQQIDNWITHTALIFQDSADFFSSIKSSIKESQHVDPQENIKRMDDAIQSLLPQQSIDLEYSAPLAPPIDIAADTPNIAPHDLLPNLFTPRVKSGASFKGEVVKDVEDKIIGGKVQLAIPTDL